MIWFLSLGLCLVVFTYLITPLFFVNPMPENIEGSTDNEVAAYRNELRHIEQRLAEGDCDIEALTAEKIVLERKLVKAATQTSHISPKRKPAWTIGIFAVLLASTLGIYGAIGSPRLTLENALTPAVLSSEQALAQSAPNSQHENNASMEELILGLEKKLEIDSQNPQKWGLYARSLMAMNRFDEAFVAYEKTLSLTDNNPEILAELESARAYARQHGSQPQKSVIPVSPSPGPNSEDIAAAAQMSADDRNAMIQGMVEGLSLKLADNPDDPGGWIRLLRARKVLGQSEVAEEEILVMQRHFKNDPETVSAILMQSGWNN